MHRQDRGGVGLAPARVAVPHRPQHPAGLRIEGHHGGVGLLQEQPPVRVGEPAGDRVAAHHGDDARLLPRRVAPEDLAVLVEVEGVDHVGEGRVHDHDVPDHDRRALVPAQHAGGEGPGDLEARDVAGVDPVEVGIAGVGVIQGLEDRPGGRRAGGRSGEQASGRAARMEARIRGSSRGAGGFAETEPRAAPPHIRCWTICLGLRVRLVAGLAEHRHHLGRLAGDEVAEIEPLADEAVAAHVLEQGEQRRPELGHRDQHHRLPVPPELRPGQLLDQLLQGADAARQGHEGVRALEHQALAGVHVGHHHGLLDVRQHVLARLEEVRDDAGDVAAGRERRPRHRAHQADIAAAVDEAHPGLRERGPEDLRGLAEGRITAEAGAAIDTDCPHRSHPAPSSRVRCEPSGKSPAPGAPRAKLLNSRGIHPPGRRDGLVSGTMYGIMGGAVDGFRAGG